MINIMAMVISKIKKIVIKMIMNLLLDKAKLNIIKIYTRIVQSRKWSQPKRIKVSQTQEIPISVSHFPNTKANFDHYLILIPKIFSSFYPSLSQFPTKNILKLLLRMSVFHRSFSPFFIYWRLVYKFSENLNIKKLLEG